MFQVSQVTLEFSLSLDSESTENPDKHRDNKQSLNVKSQGHNVGTTALFISADFILLHLKLLLSEVKFT